MAARTPLSPSFWPAAIPANWAIPSSRRTGGNPSYSRVMALMPDADTPGSRERSRSRNRKGWRWGRYAAGSGLNRGASVEINRVIWPFRGGGKVEPLLAGGKGEEMGHHGKPPHGQGTPQKPPALQTWRRGEPFHEQLRAGSGTGQGNQPHILLSTQKPCGTLHLSTGKEQSDTPCVPHTGQDFPTAPDCMVAALHHQKPRPFAKVRPVSA